MKINYIRYNWFCYGAITLFSHLFLMALTAYCKGVSEFEPLTNLLTGTLAIQTFITGSLISFLVLLFVMELFIRKGQKHPLKNWIKFLSSTYRIRKFCRFSTTVELAYHLNSRSIHKIANRSLRTLTVDYTDKQAIFSILLPNNHDAKKRWTEMFLDIKTELNHIEPDFIFADITFEKGDLYYSKAQKMKK
ncbi:hypothetical protein [Streptococcus merionis]|uniref:hypothetical protein n=1 Tax=Streptococcus merionis TaxID=400065 RepID=UPI003514D73E